MTTLITIAVLFAVVPILVDICKIYYYYKQYITSEYYELTKNPYKKVVDDRGLRGEYRVYKNLTKLEGKKRFLFNLYLPKDDGETTEVDVIMLHASGIYVFESKNYSGWIFGGEYQKNWTQTLPGRRKHAHYEHFMNPIAQNNVHLKWLDRALNDDSLVKHSYIVFGSDCELKNVTLKDDKHHVLIVDDLLYEVQKTAKTRGRVLSDEQIEAIYSRLIEFCNADEAVKKAHIEDVERKKNHLPKTATAQISVKPEEESPVTPDADDADKTEKSGD